MVNDDARAARAARDEPPERSVDAPVCIMLTKAQLEKIAHSNTAARGPSLNLVLSGLIAREAISATALETTYRVELESGRLSHALFRGLLILAFFISAEADAGIVEVARQLGLNSSTTHRYITTLVAFGLLVQDPTTRKYRLPAE